MRILQCFNWRLQDIIPELEKIKEQGFDAIQINPIQRLKLDGLREWCMSYQPVGFEIGNYFGTREDLLVLCNACKQVGLFVFADAVINHVGSKEEGSLEPHPRVEESLRNNQTCWRVKQNVTDWKNRSEVIHYCMGLPGLNLYCKEVEDRIVNFLKDLIACGVTGFRFDAAKSVGLPSEGYCFWPDLVDRLKCFDLFLYGEVIFEEDRRILDEYSEYMNILGNYDCSDTSKMVKYAESHDTYLSTDNLGYTRGLSSETILYDYCSLVGNYENTLFYTRPWDRTWEREEIRIAHQRKKVKEYVRK